MEPGDQTAIRISNGWFDYAARLCEEPSSMGANDHAILPTLALLAIAQEMNEFRKVIAVIVREIHAERDGDG